MRTGNLTMLVAALAVGLCVPPPAHAAAMFTLSTGPLDSPNAVVAGQHGAMWLAQDAPLNTGSRAPQYAVERVDLAGHYRLFHTHGATNDIAVSRGGTVFATERDRSGIAIVSPGGVREVSTPTPGSHPDSITAGPDGNGWFVEDDANRIGRVTPAGVITEFSVPPVDDPFDGGLTDAAPTVIAAGRDGRLWFGIDNGIATSTTAGTVTEYGWSFGFAAEELAIAAAPDGTVWTSELEQLQLDHVAADGSAVAVPLAASAAALGVEHDGTLWAFDVSNPYRWPIRDGQVGQRQTLSLLGRPGQRVAVTARGSRPVAAGPAGTLWISADLALSDGGEVTGIVVLDDAGRCIVPKLRGDTLAQAKLDLANHSCRLGAVRYHNPNRLPTRDLSVGQQSPSPGRVTGHETRVTVTLS